MDDVHDMMDDISEQNEIAEEISSALSTPIGFNQEIDDVRNCDHNRQWSVLFGPTIEVQGHSTICVIRSQDSHELAWDTLPSTRMLTLF